MPVFLILRLRWSRVLTKITKNTAISTEKSLNDHQSCGVHAVEIRLADSIDVKIKIKRNCCLTRQTATAFPPFLSLTTLESGFKTSGSVLVILFFLRFFLLYVFIRRIPRSFENKQRQEKKLFARRVVSCRVGRKGTRDSHLASCL